MSSFIMFVTYNKSLWFRVSILPVYGFNLFSLSDVVVVVLPATRSCSITES